ncbi:hypothetical protein [Thiolapillus sp.]
MLANQIPIESKQKRKVDLVSPLISLVLLGISKIIKITPNEIGKTGAVCRAMHWCFLQAKKHLLEMPVQTGQGNYSPLSA